MKKYIKIEPVNFVLTYLQKKRKKKLQPHSVSNKNFKFQTL